ncbi:MAG TPA: hypothetical protein VI685_22210 [Candidatus Angelobacter sp.]
MIDKAAQRPLMLRYLLGELPPDECAQFEDTYLKDSDVFQEVVALENELIDQYVLGELIPAERERFERSLPGKPARREAVETARTLLSYSAASEGATLSRTPESVQGRRASWGVQVAAAAVFIAMIGGISWLAFTNHRLQNELIELQRRQSVSASDKQTLQRQIENLRADLQQRDTAIQQMAQLPPPDRDTVSLSLGPGMSRANGELPSLVIPASAAYVALYMVLEADSHRRYSVSVKTVDGDLVWRKNNIEGRSVSGSNKEIVVKMPSRLLQIGDYVVRVSAGSENVSQDLAGYSFHVTRR